MFQCKLREEVSLEAGNCYAAIRKRTSLHFKHVQPSKDILYLIHTRKIINYDIMGGGVGRLRGPSSLPNGNKNFHFSTSSRLALGSTQPPVQWVPGGSSQG
jgi:hypothetical protein